MISAFGMNASTLVSNTNTSISTEEGDGFGLAFLDFVTELASRPVVPHVLSLSLGSLRRLAAFGMLGVSLLLLAQLGLFDTLSDHPTYRPIATDAYLLLLLALVLSLAPASRGAGQWFPSPNSRPRQGRRRRPHPRHRRPVRLHRAIEKCSGKG